MLPAENKGFTDVMRGTFDAYGRQIPMAETLALWWRLLQPYDLQTVAKAFGQYVATEPKFPPTPAQILWLLGQGSGDNRPGADEAWSTALLSRDEAATVVWTEETAAAFGACRPVLDLGDEVGARMAFRQAYDRMVAKARSSRTPVRWTPSLGWDVEQRERTLLGAVDAGLLPAPQVAGLLPPPAVIESDLPEVDRQAIDRIKLMLATTMTPGQKRQREREEASATERERLEELKRQTDERVREYFESQNGGVSA